LEKFRVAVIGAGIAGLAAAYRCIENGERNVVVLEADAVAGGLSRSISDGGFIFDLGPHQIHTPYEEVILFLQRLLAADLLVEKKRASQKFLGREINYPLCFNDVLFKLPPAVSFATFLSYLRQQLAGLFGKGEPTNFAEWVIHNFGQKLYDVYFGPYTTKVWGVPPTQMTASSAAERIAVPSLLDVLLNAISHRFLRFGKHHNLPHSPYQRIFHYPRRGSGQLADLMAERIVNGGGRILCHQPVSRLQSGAESMRIECGSGYELSAEQVVSTIPIDRLQLMLEGSPRQNPRLELRYRSLILFFLKVAKARVMPYHWIYFPDRDCIFQRASEFTNFSEAMAPAGKTGICLEIPCDYQDGVWKMDPAALFARVMGDAQRQNYLNSEWVEGFRIVRERHAYPLYELGCEKKLARIKEYLGSFPRLQSVGRQGEFRYINVDDALLTGFAAADRLRAITPLVLPLTCLARTPSARILS